MMHGNRKSSKISNEKTLGLKKSVPSKIMVYQYYLSQYFRSSFKTRGAIIVIWLLLKPI